jgi:hypothetical protein
MQRFAPQWLALAMSASVAEADSITVTVNNNNTPRRSPSMMARDTAAA